MEQIFNELKKKFAFVNELDNKSLTLFRDTMIPSVYEEGTILLDEDRHCRGVVFILEGVIRIYKLSESGKEITLYRIGEGETCIFSISCNMSNISYKAIAQVEETAKIVMIPAEVFKRLFTENPAIQKHTFDTLATRLSEIMLVVEEISFHSMDKRIAAFLLDMVKNTKNNVIKTTHEKIAYELGTAREVVSRILKELEKNNAIKLSRGLIEVQNIEVLRNII